MKRTLLSLLAVSIVCSAAAQTVPAKNANAEEVRALFEAIHMREMLGNFLKAYLSGMGPIMDKIFTDSAKNMDAEDRAFAVKVIQQNAQKLLGQEYSDQVIAIATPIYQKYMSEEDVKAATVFYSSPVGQRYLTASPVIQKEMMEQVTPIVKDKMDLMEKAVADEFYSYMKKKYGDKGAPAAGAEKPKQ